MAGFDPMAVIGKLASDYILGGSGKSGGDTVATATAGAQVEVNPEIISVMDTGPLAEMLGSIRDTIVTETRNVRTDVADTVRLVLAVGVLALVVMRK